LDQLGVVADVFNIHYLSFGCESSHSSRRCRGRIDAKINIDVHLYGVLLEILYFLILDGLSSHVLSVFLDQEIVNFGILDAVVAADNQILITYVEHCLTLGEHEVLLFKWVLDTCEVLSKRLDDVDEIEIKVIKLLWFHIA
jgi:hypothetical protein